MHLSLSPKLSCVSHAHGMRADVFCVALGMRAYRVRCDSVSLTLHAFPTRQEAGAIGRWWICCRGT
eukprot:3648643-Rhodomonas_salina.1